MIACVRIYFSIDNKSVRLFVLSRADGSEEISSISSQNSILLKSSKCLSIQMLLVDPSCRPSCSQILEHLSSLSLENSIDLTTDIDFEITNTDSPITETMPPQDSSLHQSSK